MTTHVVNETETGDLIFWLGLCYPKSTCHADAESSLRKDAHQVF